MPSGAFHSTKTDPEGVEDQKYTVGTVLFHVNIALLGLYVHWALGHQPCTQLLYLDLCQH